ncbi:hypothetical protein [Acanthopleuribacter pedis]|uniref:Uncharacterized protein n=1 Tax=Acanthopleuribacter pedis TaxID=442870 RepID=A0A8J7U820_9BACT|nr:hypothetical protein [Acanthopleuribacter pedis]MBO1323113.1 hypothetical protein [Acanthopleuribacter pedis]
MTPFVFCLLLTTLMSEPMVGADASQSIASSEITVPSGALDSELAPTTQTDLNRENKSHPPLLVSASAVRSGGVWRLVYSTTTATVQGGCAPYSYQWRAGPYVVPDRGLTGAQARFITALGTNSYATVTVTDRYGATATTSVQLYYPLPPW